MMMASTVNLQAQTTIGGVNLGNLTDYLFFFADGSKDANWQGATKGFAGDVAVNGVLAKERTSGGVPYAGTIYTNSSSLEGWSNIVSQNSPGQVTPAQAFGRTNEGPRINSLTADLNSAFAQINALPASPGYASVSATSLNGLNTKNGTAQTFVINITSDLKVTSKINITGDAGDVFILRWDSDGNPNNGYQGQVKFQSGGAIVPLGDLKPSNFINVAGDINASGGGSTPPLPYPQGPRFNNGAGSLVAKGSNFSGGGYFTGYWLTTGDPSDRETASLSNAIFVGGWYTTTTKFSMTSGTSGVYVAPPPPPSPPSTSCIGEAANYVLLGLQGGTVSINSATNVIGNVGYSAGVTSTTNQKVGDGGLFNGTVYVHSNVAQFQYTDKNFLPSGGIVQNNAAQSARLDQANASAVAASASFAAFTPNIVFGALGDNDSRTINRVGKVTVVQIGSLNYNEDQLTLVGQPGQNDAFIINVLGNFEFSGSSIILQNVSPNMVVFNFPNASTVKLNKSTNIFNGTILAPTGSVEYHNPAIFNGGIIAKNITVHSDFNITSKPLQIPCTPVTVCDNVTLGGSIGFAPYCKAGLQYCPSDGPIPTIISCVDPTGGGNGDLEIVWLRSRTGVCSYPTRTADEIMAGLDPNWEIIPNANGLSYTPTSVTQKTCYLRCARRPGCTTFVESNIISLSPSPDCGGPGPNCSNIVIEGNRGGNINISQIDPNAYTIVQIYDLTTWAEVFKCDGTCSTPNMTIALDPYSYYLVKVKYFQFENGFLNIVCEKNETIDFRASLEGHLGEQFNFEAVKQVDFTALMWTHNQGNLVANYVLEGSTDNIHFKTIDQQASDGSTGLKVYEGYDLEPSTGDNYYRLRMEMKDGSVVYSDVKLVNFPDLTNYVVFPNPANSFAKVNLEKIIGKQDVKMILFNDLGLEVKRFQLEEVYGKYYQMDLRDVKEGHYVLWINVPGRRAVAQQLVVGRL